MHELSIALSLVDQVRRIAEKESARQVVSVRVRVGAMSGVDGEALTFCFPMAAREFPILENARLEIVAEPMQWFCLECRQRFAGESVSERVCPHCGGLEHHLTGSDTLTLESLEVA
ncbi:MAG: hydrogenase maturation nickel metallochaperone HypA [Magnetococcales bacterium]|nr:hydrogenase maturation nickel metallochaperone HypA [Magnetococcales bacterium]MBF0263555.1 hydrogenase maturation nickel metallochaperone HypA [Magnetococcales bacterium]